MKLEELIKEVIKLNKINKKLNIKDRYVVCLNEVHKGFLKNFEFDKVDFKELERYYIDEIYEKLINYKYDYMGCTNCWTLEIYYNRENYYFDLFIRKENEIR